MALHSYILALGSNRRHVTYGPPRRVIAAAVDALKKEGCTIEAQSPIIASRPLGPSQRTFANAVVAVRTDLDPHAMLAAAHAIERSFGRRRTRRWAARVIDIDIIWWSGGIVATRDLTIPHPAFRKRDFVLRPLKSISPRLRDPLTGRNIAQLHHRLCRNVPHA